MFHFLHTSRILSTRIFCPAYLIERFRLTVGVDVCGVLIVCSIREISNVLSPPSISMVYRYAPEAFNWSCLNRYSASDSKCGALIVITQPFSALFRYFSFTSFQQLARSFPAFTVGVEKWYSKFAQLFESAFKAICNAASFTNKACTSVKSPYIAAASILRLKSLRMPRDANASSAAALLPASPPSALNTFFIISVKSDDISAMILPPINGVVLSSSVTFPSKSYWMTEETNVEVLALWVPSRKSVRRKVIRSNASALSCLCSISISVRRLTQRFGW